MPFRMKFVGYLKKRRNGGVKAKNKEKTMDCNNCVCTLCCRYAQGKEHREKIRAGKISCCDYYPRPDHALEKAIKAVSEMDVQSGVPQSVYVIEE